MITRTTVRSYSVCTSSSGTVAAVQATRTLVGICGKQISTTPVMDVFGQRRRRLCDRNLYSEMQYGNNAPASSYMTIATNDVLQTPPFLQWLLI